MKNIIYFYLFIAIIVSFLFIYYLYNIMTQTPICAIAVFTDDKIKGYVKFTENFKTNNFWPQNFIVAFINNQPIQK